MGKKITCGIFLFCKKQNKILTVKTSLNKKLSIPKGHFETEDKTYLTAAIRECFEETGYKVSIEDIFESLPESIYNKSNKTLKSFLLIKEELINFIPQCTSYYVGIDGKEYLECESFDWLSLDEAKSKLHYTQSRLIDEIKIILNDRKNNS